MGEEKVREREWLTVSLVDEVHLERKVLAVDVVLGRGVKVVLQQRVALAEDGRAPVQEDLHGRAEIGKLGRVDGRDVEIWSIIDHLNGAI